MAELIIARASDCPRTGTVTPSRIDLYGVGTVREGQSPMRCSSFALREGN